MITVRMLDQYVAAAFLWLSPVLFPYQLFPQRFRNTETTLMIKALNLYIPSIIDNEAHQLLRFRRHMVKRWQLWMAPFGNWEIQYMQRYWSFLGHVCRLDFRARYPARAMLHHIVQQHSQTLSRAGPWSTPHGLLTKIWTESGHDGDCMLASRAFRDREHWKGFSPTFLAWQDSASKRYQCGIPRLQPVQTSETSPTNAFKMALHCSHSPAKEFFAAAWLLKLKVFPFGESLQGLLTRVNFCACDSLIYIAT